MTTFSNLRLKSYQRSLYAEHSNKKCCSFSIDPVLQTLQIFMSKDTSVSTFFESQIMSTDTHFCQN